MHTSGSAAVAVNDQLTYAVVEIQQSGTSEEESDATKTGKGKRRVGAALEKPQVKYLIVAADLVPALQAKWGVTLEVKGTCLGSALEHCRYTFPQYSSPQSPGFNCHLNFSVNLAKRSHDHQQTGQGYVHINTYSFSLANITNCNDSLVISIDGLCVVYTTIGY